MRLLVIFILAFACIHAEQNIPGEAQEVLDYWFGALKSPSDYPEIKAQIWFRKNEKIDSEIRSKFGSLVISASMGLLEHWETTAQGRLALIILSDQFTRNIYRNDPRAFSMDSFAQKLALEGLRQKDDKQLPFVQRVFFYLPFQHAEDVSQQLLSTSKFQELVDEVPSSFKSIYESYLSYAMGARAIIERFGRFPHRNQVLSRETTPEEQAFLAFPGS